MILMKFIKNWWRISEGLSVVVIVVMIESMLMQRLEKSTMDTMVPIRAMEVFALTCAH
jgi:hypothetical protein